MRQRRLNTYKGLHRLAIVLLAALSVNAFAEPVNPFAKPPLIAPITANDISTSSTNTLKLRGVLVAGPESLANIGGTLYGLNEEVGGMRIADIGEDYVALAGKDSQLRLTLADSQSQKRKR